MNGDRFADDPLSAHLLGLPKPKPACVCGHPHAMHRLGPCALYRGPVMTTGSCWCDAYEPVDECRGAFPVVALEQPKDE